MSAQKSRLITLGLAASAVSLLAAAPRASALVSSPAATTGQSVTTGYAVTDHGVVAPVAPAATGGTAVSASLSRGERQTRTPATTAATATAQAPTATAASAASSATVLHNFNGTSSLDSELTNYRARFEPPDQGLCAGNGFVLEPVNSAYRIYHTDGSTIEGPFNVNDLYNEGGQEFTSDPRCHFDASTNTWFAIILFISLDGTSSHLDVAVNPSGDPTTLWTEYQFDTTHHGGNGCPCFGDQPLLGIDRDNLYVSTNEFSILGPQFNGAQIYAFSKSDLIKVKPLHFVHFGNLKIGGGFAASVQPAITSGSAAAEYFLSSLDPNATFDDRIGVWAFTGRDLAGSGNVPNLSSTIITSETYGFPVQAAQKGSSSQINPDDDRMQQVQFIGGNVWGELETSLTIPGDSAQRDGAAWFVVHPSLTGGGIGTSVIKHQGYVEQSGAYLLYPALQADSAGRSAMVFTLTGAKNFPSAAYATLNTGAAQFGAPVIGAPGTGPYDPKATRWGDYSWAVLNSASDDFWLATEYMPPSSSQTTTGQRNWGTRVFDVSVS